MDIDAEWMMFLNSQNTALFDSPPVHSSTNNNKINDKIHSIAPTTTNEDTIKTDDNTNVLRMYKCNYKPMEQDPTLNAVKPFDLIISTKTKVLFLNKPIDIHNIFWKIPIIYYWKPEQGVIKKQIKVVSKTKEELEIYKEKLKNIDYYQENIIRQIDNPGSRSIKFKDERKITIGMSKKDITTQRTRIKNAFYNCMAIILRFKFNGVFKEIHVKIFNTGKMEIPGIVDYSMLEYVKQMVLDILKPYDIIIDDSIINEPNIAATDDTTNIQDNICLVNADDDDIENVNNNNNNNNNNINIEPITSKQLQKHNVPVEFVENFKEEHVLINSNFNCGFFVNREKLYIILNSPKYGLETSFDPCNYPGVKCRFYFNNNIGLDIENQKGIILPEDRSMKMSVLIECKKYTEVSFMVFRTGSCIIVGNCSEKILRFIFEFIKKIMIQEYENICSNTDTPQIKNKTVKLLKRNISVTFENDELII
jgi:hypothetical protein